MALLRKTRSLGEPVARRVAVSSSRARLQTSKSATLRRMSTVRTVYSLGLRAPPDQLG